MSAKVVPIRTEADDFDLINHITAKYAKEILDTLDRFQDREAREMLVRCSLHTYYAQRYGRR